MMMADYRAGFLRQNSMKLKFWMMLQIALLLSGCAMIGDTAHKRVYFTYSVDYLSEKYNSRTRVFSKQYCRGKNVRIRVPRGIIDVEMLARQAKILNEKIDKNTADYCDSFPKVCQVQEVCTGSPCRVYKFEYAIDGVAEILDLEEIICCRRESHHSYIEYAELVGLVHKELRKVKAIAELPEDDGGCSFH